jgi:hypothetical protein
VLLGRTIDAGRIWDVIATAKYLAGENTADRPKTVVQVAGKGPASLLAAYAAVLEEKIAAATLIAPPASHRDSAAPPLLNVLRVCDVPEALGLLAPRPLNISGSPANAYAKTKAAYAAASAAERLSIRGG